MRLFGPRAGITGLCVIKSGNEGAGPSVCTCRGAKLGAGIGAGAGAGGENTGAEGTGAGGVTR